jgi:hypothetical protein
LKLMARNKIELASTASSNRTWAQSSKFKLTVAISHRKINKIHRLLLSTPPWVVSHRVWHRKANNSTISFWANEVRKNIIDVVRSSKIFDPPLHKCEPSKVSPEVYHYPHPLKVS